MVLIMVFGLSSVIIAFTLSNSDSCATNGVVDVQSGIWEDGFLLYGGGKLQPQMEQPQMSFADKLARRFTSTKQHK